MTRYRDFHGSRGIAAYEVWNEGNVPTFWTGTPAQLARLTRIVWRTRRQVDPGATVVGPSFAARLSSQRQWLFDYTSQRVAGKPVWRYYDATALSLYPKATYGDRIGGPEDAMAVLARARRRLAAAGAPKSQPIWGTEVNYGVTSDGSAARPVSERRQVANVIRTYLLGAAGGLKRMFWYRYDWGLVRGGTLGNTLLATPGAYGQITPAGDAVITAESWMKGRLVGRHGQPPCHQDAKGTFRCVIKHAGGVRTILWNPKHRVRVPMPRGADQVQDARGVSSADRRRQSTLAVSYLPVMVSSSTLSGPPRRTRQVAVIEPRRPPRPNVAMPWSRTWKANGPTTAIRPGPTAPRERQARKANATAQPSPAPTPRSAASSHRGVG